MTVVATGGTITYANGKKIHTFTEDGTFTVTLGGEVELLMVAGGGSGGVGFDPWYHGGGGGAGGVIYNAALTVAQSSIEITIGQGGAAQTATGEGISGTNTVLDDGSVLFGLLTAIGGGRGGGFGASNDPLPGGSGGGGVYNAPGAAGTAGQGYKGGNGGGFGTEPAGGGGAGGAGGDYNSGNGGIGAQYSISGTTLYYAGGGAGGNGVGIGGLGGGGDSGEAGSFYGAGGSGNIGNGTPSFAGHEGVVIIAYDFNTPDRRRAQNEDLANMAAGTIKGRVTTSGIPQDLTASQVGSILVNGLTADTLADADEFSFWKAASSTLKKITWANILATIKTYTDTLYTAKNTAITGATKTKITYDAKGLVTSGADATTADIASSTNKRYVTDADLVDIGNLSGTNTGDQDLSGLQPLDADLTAIAGLSPSNDDIIQRKSGAWTSRTIAQLTTDLLSATATTQVLYNDTGVIEGEDNFVYDKTYSAIQIGGTNWYSALLYGGVHITKESGGNFVPIVTGHSYGDGTGNFTNVPTVGGDRAGGTKAAPTTVLDDMGLARFTAGGYDGSALSGTRAQMVLAADGNWSGTSHPTKITFWTTPVGSVTRAQVLEIDNAGVATFTSNAVNITGATNPYLWIAEGAGTSAIFIKNISATQSEIQHYNAGAGSAIIDINPVPSDGASASAFRFYRGVTTSGRASFTIYNANAATPVANHDIAGNGHTYLSGIAGYNINIGGGTAPASKLFIEGSGDIIQLTVRGHSSQTANIFVIENSAGGDFLSVGSAGKIASAITTTTTSGTAIGVGVDHTLAPSTSPSTAEYRSLTFLNYIGTSAVDTTVFSGAGIYGGYFQNRPRTTGTIALVSGVYLQGVALDSSSGNATITSVYGALIYGTGRPSGTSTLTSTVLIGAYINANTVATGVTATTLTGLQIATPSAGTFNLDVGIQVDAQTRASVTNVGIRIYEPSGATNNYALQLIGTGGTAASGITFGTDTNLYRSAADTLKTDDSIIVMEGMVVNENGTATSDFRVESDTEPNMIYLDANGNTDGTLYLGGSTNGIEIKKGGELRLIGTATRWNDLRVEPVVRTTGVKAPTFVAYKTNVYLYDFDNAVLASEKEVYFTVQLPHDWKEGSTIYPHVHWVNRTTGTAGHVIKWAMDYTKAKIGGTFPATSNINGTAIVGGGDITVADEHMITSLTAITMTGDTISTVLICRLYRNSSDAADTYAGTAGLLYVDFHYEIDSIGGSADEFTK